MRTGPGPIHASEVMDAASTLAVAGGGPPGRRAGARTRAAGRAGCRRAAAVRRRVRRPLRPAGRVPERAGRQGTRDPRPVAPRRVRADRPARPRPSRLGRYRICVRWPRYAGAVAAYLPPGWPAGVHPPDSEEFEQTAVTWLLDVVPPDYRLHGVLRRHPMALAAMARHHTAACVEGARQGYRTARTELAAALPPHAVDAVLAAYRTEGRRLAATERAVILVERAMRGESFTPKL